MTDPSTQPMGSSAAASPADLAWDEAFLRVESYLRAHHLESRVRLNQLTTEIITEARSLAVAHPSAEPVALAMQVTHSFIGSWFAQAGDESGWATERDRAHGRLALVIANLPGRWSNCFLSTEPVPPELMAAMASFKFYPGPELRFSNMAPAALEFGTSEAQSPASEKHGTWVVARTAAVWLAVAGLIGAAWAASH